MSNSNSNFSYLNSPIGNFFFKENVFNFTNCFLQTSMNLALQLGERGEKWAIKRRHVKEIISTNSYKI